MSKEAVEPNVKHTEGIAKVRPQKNNKINQNLFWQFYGFCKAYERLVEAIGLKTSKN